MRYAVLGTGGVGQALAGRLSELGHDVVMGTRDPKASLARTEPGTAGSTPVAQWLDGKPQIRLLAFDEAAAFAERVVNATSGQHTLTALRAAGAGNLAGKILIDAANPLDFSTGLPPSLDPVNTDSLGEQVQRAFPEAKVVKTFHTMNATVMVDPARVPGEHDIFLCGDDDEAKQSVRALLAEIGWPEGSVIDLGDISTARGTEMMVALWLRLYGAFGHADFNIHVQRAS